MGLIAAALGAVGGGLADQWLEVIEASDMGEGVVLMDATQTKKVRLMLFQMVLLYT